MRSLVHLHSALFQQLLPCQEWWYSLLLPNRHYIPVNRDLSNLGEQVSKARARDEAMRLMAQRLSQRAAPLLKKKAILGYVEVLLTQYTQLLRFRVTLDPRAEPITKLPAVVAPEAPKTAPEDASQHHAAPQFPPQ